MVITYIILEMITMRHFQRFILSDHKKVCTNEQFLLRASKPVVTHGFYLEILIRKRDGLTEPQTK